jgi:hypothetical protein
VMAGASPAWRGEVAGWVLLEAPRPPCRSQEAPAVPQRGLSRHRICCHLGHREERRGSWRFVVAAHTAS